MNVNAKLLIIFVFCLTFLAVYGGKIPKKTKHRKTPKEDEEHHTYGELQDLLKKIKAYRTAKEARIAAGQDTQADWDALAGDALRRALETKINTNVAKNVILFIGDGLSIPTSTAARIMEGHEKGLPEGEIHELSYEKFPYSGLSKTGDSSACATALLCGVKGNFLTIGVNASAWQADCKSVLGNEVESIILKASRSGRSSGIVTNTRVTHATPAAAYAHSALRYWEHDGDLFPWDDPDVCLDHAAQMIKYGMPMDVVMGGGRSYFLDDETEDPVDFGRYGDREDGRNLIQEWLGNKTSMGQRGRAVYTRDDLFGLDMNTTDAVLGLFRRGHMSYHRSRDPDLEPSLSEMTRKAIELLSRNNKGYVLMVEGGRIDVAHHGSRAWTAITDTIEYASAVQTAADMTSEEDTLIIVTADHAHTMAFGGYHFRGTKVLDHALYPSFRDLMPYTRITYGNGPGFNHTAGPNGRQDLWNVDTTNPRYVPQSAVPMGSETHGADEVGIYSRGPMAHLLTGVKEQNYIAHVAQYAGCFGSYTGERCARPANNKPDHLPQQ